MADAPAQDVYEIRPRKDGDGVDLISDRLRRGPIWYAGPDAVRNAVAYAKYRSRSRSHLPIIRVLDQSGAVIETSGLCLPPFVAMESASLAAG
jgi:hypothetical protein